MTKTGLTVRLKGVTSYQRNGKTVWRYRKTGQKTVYLKGKPNSDEFMRSYEAARDGLSVEDKVLLARTNRPYSLHSLIAIYKTSEAYEVLKPSTKETYARLLARLDKAYGHSSVKDLTPKIVRNIRDRATSPATGNRFVSLLSVLCEEAKELSWIKANPAKGVRKRKYKKKSHHDWTDAEMGLFLNRYQAGSRERLAFLLLFDTAQRGGDTHKFGPQHLKNGVLSVHQEKTGAILKIPLQPETLAEIKRHKSNQLSFILTEKGLPYRKKPFQQWFSKACTKTGLTHCSAHGLRGARLRVYAENGATFEQMKSIGGHETDSQLQVYIRNAKQTRIAERTTSELGALNLATLKLVAKNGEKKQ